MDWEKLERPVAQDAVSALCYAYSAKRYRLKTLTGHTSWVLGALQLADGRLITWAGGFVGSEGTKARLWAADGASGPVLKGHSGGVLGALELADVHLMIWSNDNTARLWPLERDLVAWADRLIADLKPLSLGERCRYYLEPADKCQGVTTE